MTDSCNNTIPPTVNSKNGITENKNNNNNELPTTTSTNNNNNNNHNTATIPSLVCAIGSPTTILSDEDIANEIRNFLQLVGTTETNTTTTIDDVLLIPPDYTRYHSYAGRITQMICEYYNYIPPSAPIDSTQQPSSSTTTTITQPSIEILPALGTHAPMTNDEIKKMFGSALAEKEPSPFLVHDWRNDIINIGEVPASMVEDATKGKVKNTVWPAQINKRIWDRRREVTGNKSLLLSIGQVVPHEVMGMANYNKNVFVGAGGTDAINLSHFIGAVIGMETIMGRTLNPLRDLLNYASQQYLENQFNLWYILTVIGYDETTNSKVVRGLYIGRDIECYLQACDLSLQVNFTLLETPIERMVVYLDPDTYHSTWLGNKAIYRTRMAMADAGELLIIGPGIRKFGEDAVVDTLIRQYGYKGTDHVMTMMEQHVELQDNLSAVAHLLHGSSEGRFTITYCPGYLSQSDIEQVGFQYKDVTIIQQRYNVTTTLHDGWNIDPIDNKPFYYISNPGLGLWATKSRFFG